MSSKTTSLKALATARRPAVEAPAAIEAPQAPAYRTAATRTGTRTLSGHFPAHAVQAFRVLAAEQDMDVQELMAEGINMVFERFGRPDRIEITSGRRKRD
jgi:hypothetical protein